MSTPTGILWYGDSLTAVSTPPQKRKRKRGKKYALLAGPSVERPPTPRYYRPRVKALIIGVNNLGGQYEDAVHATTPTSLVLANMVAAWIEAKDLIDGVIKTDGEALPTQRLVTGED